MANKWYFDLPCEACVIHDMPRKQKTKKNISRNISKSWLERLALLLSTLRDPVLRECRKKSHTTMRTRLGCEIRNVWSKMRPLLWPSAGELDKVNSNSRIKFSRSEFEYASCQLPSVLSCQLLLGIRYHKQNKISVYSLIVKRAF